MLGPLLRAGLVDDVASGERLLDSARRWQRSSLVRGFAHAFTRPLCRRATAHLSRHVPETSVAPLAERLLAGAWVVESLDALPQGFTGVAVTRAGRVLFGSTGELRQAPAGGEQRVLEQRNRARGAEASKVASTRRGIRGGGGRTRPRLAVTEAYASIVEGVLRAAVRDLDEAAEAVRRAEWVIERRREAPDEGPAAVRQASCRPSCGRAAARRAGRPRARRADAQDRVAARSRQHDRQLALDAERAAAALSGTVRGGEGDATARGRARGRSRGWRGDARSWAQVRPRGGRDPGAAAGRPASGSPRPRCACGTADARPGPPVSSPAAGRGGSRASRRMRAAALEAPDDERRAELIARSSA